VQKRHQASHSSKFHDLFISRRVPLTYTHFSTVNPCQLAPELRYRLIGAPTLTTASPLLSHKCFHLCKQIATRGLSNLLSVVPGPNACTPATLPQPPAHRQHIGLHSCCLSGSSRDSTHLTMATQNESSSNGVAARSAPPAHEDNTENIFLFVPNLIGSSPAHPPHPNLADNLQATRASCSPWPRSTTCLSTPAHARPSTACHVSSMRSTVTPPEGLSKAPSLALCWTW
jgi:hypothetical protein